MTDPQITLCRFALDGHLRSERWELGSIPHVAISHIWGNAEWETVPSLGREVLATPEKVAFLTNQLPSLVGSSLFWMDILCVDQRDGNDRIAIVQHIPAIYQLATKTIVVRDSSGLKPCCAAAFGNFSEWPDYIEGRRRFMAHHMPLVHASGLIEGILTRLWPLQEIILSTTIQFTSCFPVHDHDFTETLSAKKFDPYAAQLTGKSLIDSLYTLSHAWSTADIDQCAQADVTEIERRQVRLIQALIHSGIVTRADRTTIPAPSDMAWGFPGHANRPFLNFVSVHRRPGGLGQEFFAP